MGPDPRGCLMFKYIYPIPSPSSPRYLFLCCSINPSSPSSPPPKSTPSCEPMSVSVRPTEYDLLEEHFDLPSEEAPPYLLKAPPAYKLNPVRYLALLPTPSSHRSIMDSPSQPLPRGHGLRAIAGGELSPGAGPDDPSKTLPYQRPCHTALRR